MCSITSAKRVIAAALLHCAALAALSLLLTHSRSSQVIKRFLALDVLENYRWVGNLSEPKYVPSSLVRDYVTGKEKTYWLDWMLILAGEDDLHGEELATEFGNKLFEFGCDLLTGYKVIVSKSSGVSGLHCLSPHIDELFGKKYRQNLLTLEEHKQNQLGTCVFDSLRDSVSWVAKLAFHELTIYDKILSKTHTPTAPDFLALLSLNKSASKTPNEFRGEEDPKFHKVNSGLLAHFKPLLLKHLGAQANQVLSSRLLTNQVSAKVKVMMLFTLKRIRAFCAEAGDEGDKVWKTFIREHIFSMKSKKPYLKALIQWKKENDW